MGAYTHGDEHVLMPFLRPIGERCRIAKRACRRRIGGGDFGRGKPADEQRLLAEDGLDRLPRLDRRNVDLGRAGGEHVLRRRHLSYQRIDDREAADTCRAYRSDVEEIAAANAIGGVACRFGSCGCSRVCHQRFALPALYLRPGPGPGDALCEFIDRVRWKAGAHDIDNASAKAPYVPGLDAPLAALRRVANRHFGKLYAVACNRGPFRPGTGDWLYRPSAMMLSWRPAVSSPRCPARR